MRATDRFRVVNGDAIVSDVIGNVKNSGFDYVVAVDEGEIISVIDQHTLDQLADLRFGGELVGNVASLKFRTCRPSDGPGIRRLLLEGSGVRALVVCDEIGKPRELVLRVDRD